MLECISCFSAATPFAKIISRVRELEIGSARLSRSRILFVGNQLSYSNRLAVTFSFFSSNFCIVTLGSESTTIVHASLWRSVPSRQKEHTGTFLLSGKYFLCVCCSLAETGSFYICDPVCFCLALSNSARFMPSGTMTFNANVRAIPFSRPNVPKSTHFFLYLLKVAIFSF